MALLSAFRPERWLQEKRQAVAGLETRLKWIAAAKLAFHKNRVAEMTNFLRLLGPRQTLERGYSITLDTDGNVVRSVQAVKVGDPIRTKLASGELNSVVEGLLTEN